MGTFIIYPIKSPTFSLFLNFEVFRTKYLLTVLKTDNKGARSTV